MTNIVKILDNTNTNGKKIYFIIFSSYLIGGILAVLLSIVYKFNRQQIGLAFTIGSLLSLFISQNFQIANNFQISNKNKKKKDFFIVGIIVFIYVALLAIVFFLDSMQNYYLPLGYFILITLLSLIIALQILTCQLTRFRIYTVLMEIIILTTILSTSFLFLFPGPYGNDSSFHIEFINDILNSGNINYPYAGQYQIFPIYQILFTETILLSNLGIKVATFILAIVQILFLLFIFLICDKLFNSKIALLSTLLISTSTNILVPRYYIFPGSFSVIFFIFYLYLYLTPNLKMYELRSALIILILFFVSNFTHPLLPLITIFSLMVILICIKFMRLNFKIRTSLIFSNIILMIFQWIRPPSNSGYSIFSNLIGSIRFAFEEGSSITQATSAQFYNWIDVLMYELGYTILILFGIAGALWFLRADINSIKDDIKENRILAAMVTLIFVPIPYILAVIYPNSIPARWFIYIEVVASIFAGASIYMIFETLSKYKKYKLKLLIVIPLFLLTFFSITTPTSNPNSHIYAEDLSKRSGLLESEINAAKFVNNDVDKDSIHGNFAFLQFIDKKISKNENFINPNINKTYQNGTVLIRNEDFKKGFIIPLYGHKGKLVEIDKPTDVFVKNLNIIDKIYENGEVRIYNAKQIHF